MENNGDGKFRSYLYNQFTLILAVLGLLGWFWTAFSYTKTIELKIQHLEDTLSSISAKLDTVKNGDLKDIVNNQNQIINRQVEMEKNIVENNTIIKQHMGIK